MMHGRRGRDYGAHRSGTEEPEISARTQGGEEGWGDSVHEVKG